MFQQDYHRIYLRMLGISIVSVSRLGMYTEQWTIACNSLADCLPHRCQRFRHPSCQRIAFPTASSVNNSMLVLYTNLAHG